MKTKSQSSGFQIPSVAFVVVVALFFTHFPLLADGLFVSKWKRNKQLDINEPTQKAIILYDAGREDMLLQVKYEGRVSEFGWLIPVPTLPRIEKGSMESFYELGPHLRRGSRSDHESIVQCATSRLAGPAAERGQPGTTGRLSSPLPLTHDPNETVRSRAFGAMAAITGKGISRDDPAQWERWWAVNKATFTAR
jgi:hypothetical protein